MKQKIKQIVHSVSLSVVLSAGLLSMTNIDLSWYPVAMTVSQPTGVPAKSFWKKLTESKTAADDTGPVAQLKALLAQDDLADENPFANLSSDDPLQKIYQAGITRFQRQTLRSRSYRDESGYDQVHYEIEQADGYKSHILVYLDHSADELAVEGDEPTVRKETIMIIVLTNRGEDSGYSVYQDGALLESSTISHSQAESFLTQRLSNGIPFLSVSR